MFELPSDPAEPSAACPRGTVPVWREEMPVFERATIDRDLNVDVRVVGAGIAGLTAAYLPAKGGNSVIGSPPRRRLRIAEMRPTGVPPIPRDNPTGS